MSCEVISVSRIRKAYRIFENPSHRLWYMLFGGAKRFYREHQVLDGVSFAVKKGESVGVVGRNGSGKSTLLGIICGTIPATSGEVKVAGRVAALLELGAGFNPELTGRENIDLCAQIYGLQEDQIDARRDSIIEFSDIGDHIDQPVKTYSSGMFTRLAFSVIAHVDADVLVVDEALAVGDAYFVQKCMRFLREFRSRGGTLFFVSHDMGSVAALCDRAIWLSDGKVALDATPKEIANAYLADLYRQQQDVDFARVDPVEGGGRRISEESASRFDPRRDLIVSSNLRNDLVVREFTESSSFGAGGAKIIFASMKDLHSRDLSLIVGGEVVILAVNVEATRVVHELIVGFVVKDKNGQPIFGDNTYLSHLDNPKSLGPGSLACAEFEFSMPILPVGVYSVSLAVSDGTQNSHVIMQWLHDAFVLESQSSSIATGLVGLPMQRIGLEII